VNESYGRVWLEVNLATLRNNYLKIKEAVGDREVMAILKANAYGLGVEPIAAALAAAGVRRFGVAELREALALAAKGLKTQILGCVLPEEIEAGVEHGVTLPATDLEIATLISQTADRLGKTAECHFPIDTGMGRLGILAADAVEIIAAAVKLPNVRFSGIYSHFPVAYLANNEYTVEQTYKLIRIVDALKERGINFETIHIANSDAINNYPITRMPPFNLVRAGINLYGVYDLVGAHALRLRPVLALKTKLTAVRELPASASIGYGQTYKLPKKTLVGTISAGYADGLPLALSNRGHVLIRGVPCPILGRLSMDYTTVSLDCVPDAARGDEVVCLGGDGPTAISVEDWASLKGSHPYDIICSFGNRVKRVYLA